MSKTELYHTYRPIKFSQVLGQSAAVSMLRGFVRSKKVPHAFLFSGPSGCGKTTLARIMAKLLKIDPYDTTEVNAASYKGIEMSRDIIATQGLGAMKGDARMYIIDEAHQLTSQAQDALLKPVEEPPDHLYFAFCTTHPEKIKLTLRNRCTPVEVRPLMAEDMEKLVRDVCKKENIQLEEDVFYKLIQVADGSARQALVYLNGLAGCEDEQEQLNFLTKQDAETAGIDLCRALCNQHPKWKDVAAILKNLKQEPESVRRAVLGYAESILLKSGSTRAALIMENFELNVFDSGRPGLSLRAFNCFSDSQRQ